MATMPESAPVSQPTSQPSPLLFFQTINAYEHTQVLKGAIELDVFTPLAEGAQSAEQLATRCQASARGMRILCNYLTTLGFLTKHGDRYELTPDSAMFLNRKSPAYLGGTVEFLASPMLVERASDIAANVRKGGAVGDHALEPNNPMWVTFARAMAPLMMMPAKLIGELLNAATAPAWKVLDIAAGHGTFGIELAKQNRAAEIVAVDWENVLEVAKENAQRAGVANRYRTIPGDAFDVQFGQGYDVALITNFLHHFDKATSENFLSKVRQSLKDGGRAVILEFIPDEDRVSPPLAGQFAMKMLTGTPGGDVYTFSDLQTMLRNTGYKSSELHPLPPTFQRAVIARK
jgi:2-polyprenyl-3-methyl-5-hydroxy-6-metoxy-1,4-benzoquinol methylase